MEANANGKTAVIEHIIGLATELSTRISVAAAKDIKNRSPLAACFLLHIAFALAEREKLTHDQRAALLAEASTTDEEKHIDKLTLVGSFQRLDLRGYVISNCTFKDCNLVDCTVDNNTRVISCVFEGDISLGNPSRSSNWRLVSSSNNKADAKAAIVVSTLLNSDEDQRRDILLDIFNLGLAKFWHSGRPKRTIDKENWKRGVIAQSPLCDTVLQAFIKSGLLQDIDISGTKSGGYAIDPSSLSDVQKFMDSRALTGKVADAFELSYERS